MNEHEEYNSAYEGRIGADRMARGLPCIPTKHPPAPWRVTIESPNWLGVRVTPMPVNIEQAKAMRQLIEVAPDLLEALKDIEANLRGDDYMVERRVDSIRRCQEAIAKAEMP